MLKDRWRVGRLLGEGGMARVYEAIDLLLHCPAVVKVPSSARDFRRLEREARLGAELHTPGLCKVLDLGELPGSDTPFVVFERLWGETLAERIEREPGMPWRAAVELVRAATVPLGEAHHCGVVHRDVKPENLFIADVGELRVLDFGVAHAERDETLTGAGRCVGTAAFMAPEYVMNPKVIDGRADIYALGLVLGCAVAGKEALPRPARPELVELLRAAAERPDVRQLVAELPEAVAEVIERAAALDPGARYQTMEELRAALDELLAVDAAAKRKGQGAAVRRRGWWAMLAVGVVALGLMAAWIVGRRGAGAGREVAGQVACPAAPSVPAKGALGGRAAASDVQPAAAGKERATRRPVKRSSGTSFGKKSARPGGWLRTGYP